MFATSRQLFFYFEILLSLAFPPFSLVLACHTAYSAEQSLPPAWQERWQKPLMQDRPLKIAHTSPEKTELQSYLQRGLGGLVTNVSFKDYMKSPAAWQALTEAVDSCEKQGAIVWIYDEQGYPSGGAGTLVLDRNPAFEAQELTYDKNRAEPFAVRTAFEHSHAANNYAAVRRYPNLIDQSAVECFIEVTHEQYWNRLQRHFGKTIKATFTDEPSLMAVSLRQFSPSELQKVSVVHQPDLNVPALPSVPWCDDLPEKYRQAFGEDLLAVRKSLFAGDSDADRRTRRQYWSLIADLIADRYFGALGRWADAHGIASSGHSLWEESILHHVPLEGNGLASLEQMQIPGLDCLNSSPDSVIYGSWLAAALPSSAALLNSRRDVMTEVSDFCQIMGGEDPASLVCMNATAAWQAAWGVTVFTLYYGLADRSLEDYRAYCDFVGRMNAVLQPAVPRRRVMLYYPIYDLWEEYLPSSEELKLENQSPRTRDLVRSFMQAGETLQRGQLPCILCDHTNLAKAEVSEDGHLVVGNQSVEVLVLPAASNLPPEAVEVVQRFVQKGGKVIRVDAAKQPLDPAAVRVALPGAGKIEPNANHIALGEFSRDGHKLFLMVNVNKDHEYQGRFTVGGGNWLALDPGNGSTKAVDTDADGRIELKLQPCQTVILVEMK